jgi:hypothetical protein
VELSKEEKDIFILFFLFLGIFTKTAPVVNDASRLAMVDSIVERGTLVIDDSIFNSTFDKAYINGHFYSDKAPGTASLGVPIYVVLRIFELSFSTHLELCYFILTLLTSGISLALLAVLFFRMTDPYIKDKRKRYLLTGSLLSTTLLPFSAVFNGHIIGAFLTFASFYFLFKEKNLMYSGICSGLSVIFEYPTALAGAILLAYALVIHRKRAIEFLLPFLALSSVVLLYNQALTGNPLSFPYNYVTTWEGSPWAERGSIVPIRYEKGNPMRIYDLLFDLNAGLLIYSPILLLSFLSLKKLKKNKELAIPFALLAGFVYFFWTFARIYLGGCNYGSRFFVPLIPLLLFSLVYVKEIKDKVIWLLSGLGLFINIIGAKINPWLCPSGTPNMLTALIVFLFEPYYRVSWLNIIFGIGFLSYVFRDRIRQRTVPESPSLDRNRL